jgi:uncharacterized membrane protein YgcG
LQSAIQAPGAEDLDKGILKVKGLMLDATLYDMASLAAQDMSGKPQRLTARKIETLIKCVGDTAGHVPTEHELNVFRVLLQDFDMAADAKKLLQTHVNHTLRNGVREAPPPRPLPSKGGGGEETSKKRNRLKIGPDFEDAESEGDSGEGGGDSSGGDDGGGGRSGGGEIKRVGKLVSAARDCLARRDGVSKYNYCVSLSLSLSLSVCLSLSII